MEMTTGTFIENITRTPTVESFRFTVEKKINFLPGQFLEVIFDEADYKNKELNKYLSFSSAPGKEYIEVTKRLSKSKFSQKLINLQVGDRVVFRMPMGNCIFKEEYRKIGFLIGGIGITPVISIIEYVVDKQIDCNVCLMYSNKTDDDIAFRDELDTWRSNNQNIKVFYNVTRCVPKDQKYIYGDINKKLLVERMCDWQERVMFIFGPPAMVETMKHLCNDIGCSAGNVKTETFVGY